MKADAFTTTKAEIEALSDGIRVLDKSVAEATEQRKEENEEYTALMAGNTAAKELLAFAKNGQEDYEHFMRDAATKRAVDRVPMHLRASGNL